jgi:DNA repair exonuclease SbcCD nuclease subunit
MTFTFVHTADWQIGKPFGALPPEKVALLKDARLTAISRIAEIARREGAGHVLVAGDVYESRDVPDRDLTQSLERMRRERDLTWHLLPGNHDPAQPGGVWERLSRKGVPANVRFHLAPTPVAIAPNVALLPAPLTARSSASDPTAWMEDIATPEAYRIGIAHGSVQGFGGDGEAAVPISPMRAQSARLDYLALGDWHGLTRISPRVWYSGTPEPDRYPDNEPGFVLVVRLQAPGADPVVTRHATAQYTWTRRTFELTSQASLDRLEQDLLAECPSPERVLLALTLNGSPSLGVWSEAEVRLGGLAERLFHLEVDSSRLEVLAEAMDLDELGTGDLRRAAELLSAMAKDAAHPQQACASLALRKLHRMKRALENGDRA